jgi:hypothetical protein
MRPGCKFRPNALKRLRGVCCDEPRLAALYAFGLRREQDCDLAALFTESLVWTDRLELEMRIGTALGLEGADLSDLRRVPLVTRYGIVKEGDLLYVGQPETLAIFMEQTLVRYLSLYPLLEALYWKVETGPLTEDRY